MNKDKKSIDLIDQYLGKQENKARLITVAELALKLFQKATVPSTTESEVGKRLRGQREKKGEASGHALFPHLRPMYRTVHRRKPRELVFRAIRWVNPARMFPISQYDKKKLVPFGEFLPFENFLNKFGMKKITPGYSSFSKGRGLVKGIILTPYLLFK